MDTLIEWAVILGPFIGLYKIFEKAGVEGWKAIIPFYSAYVWLQVIERPWWWLALLFVPGPNLVVLALMIHNLARSFGKSIFFTLGIIFLPFIFLPILGFGQSVYVRPTRRA